MKHDKLRVVTSLKNRGWKEDIHCCLCDNIETTKHVFFGCSLARFAWSCARDAIGWAGCLQDLSDLLSGRVTNNVRMSRGLALFIFAGVTWAVWKIRNKMAIEKPFPKSPITFVPVLHLCRNGGRYWVRTTKQKPRG